MIREYFIKDIGNVIHGYLYQIPEKNKDILKDLKQGNKDWYQRHCPTTPLEYGPFSRSVYSFTPATYSDLDSDLVMFNVANGPMLYFSLSKSHRVLLSEKNMSFDLVEIKWNDNIERKIEIKYHGITVGQLCVSRSSQYDKISETLIECIKGLVEDKLTWKQIAKIKHSGGCPLTPVDWNIAGLYFVRSRLPNYI